MSKRLTIPERHLADARSKRKIFLYYTDDLEFVREQIKDHDIHDRFDALCVFEFKLIDSLREYGEFSDEFDRMYKMYTFYRRCIDNAVISAEMASLGLMTSIDRRAHGQSLIKPLLQK